MKKIKVINKNMGECENDHEFDIVTYHKKNKDIVYELSHSMSGMWLPDIRGQAIITATDNGNGIKFKFHETYDFKQLQHYQVGTMFVLLKYIQKEDMYHKFKFKCSEKA